MHKDITSYLQQSQEDKDDLYRPSHSQDIMALADEFILYEEPMFDFLDYLYGARIVPTQSTPSQQNLNAVWRRKKPRADAESIPTINKQPNIKRTADTQSSNKEYPRISVQPDGAEQIGLTIEQRLNTESKKLEILPRNKSTNGKGMSPYGQWLKKNMSQIQPKRILGDNKKILSQQKSLEKFKPTLLRN